MTNTLQLKAWYDELNHRLKTLLKKDFEQAYHITETGFYKTINAKEVKLDRAILFADFFSRHIAPCDVVDLYRHPLEVMKEQEYHKKKGSKSPKMAVR